MMIYTNTYFFRFVPGLTKPDKDVIGFFSLILTYAKRAGRPLNKDRRPQMAIDLIRLSPEMYISPALTRYLQQVAEERVLLLPELFLKHPFQELSSNLRSTGRIFKRC